MAYQFEKLHFIVFPLMSPGHMIPMIDIAKLLAQRGAMVTIITTPVNAVRYKSIISRATELGLRIKLHELRFPCKEAGLPEGCENLDMLTSSSPKDFVNFFSAIGMMQPQFEHFMEEAEPRPSCIISDMFMAYTTQVAREFGIPRIVFHGHGCFVESCYTYIFMSTVGQGVTEPSPVPSLPDGIKITKALLDSISCSRKLRTADDVKKYQDAEKGAYGVIVNTFEELELEYVEACKKLKQKKVWCIGPVSLINKDNLDQAQRGNKNAIDENECLKWLDSLNPASAIYVCLGSCFTIKPVDMIELALGLESSNKPFIWVIRENEDLKEFKRLLSANGFEERIKGRGVLICGWAPQLLILSHPSIGAFLTHCGWNSTLEGVVAGVPLITCPIGADQYFNENLVVEVLGIGVSVGVQVSMDSWEEDKNAVLTVQKEMVEKAINTVMDGGEEGVKRREKAKKLGEMAKRAMETGGSSHNNITLFIEDIIQQLNI